MQYYIGLDLHRKFSQACVLDEKGELVTQQRLYHEEEHDLVTFFAAFSQGTPVAMEATIGWMWMADLLEEMNMEVHLAHSYNVRLIAESRLKTDKVDAWALAQLLRTDFLPHSYLAPTEVRDQRMLLRHHETMVHNRTDIKNRVHAVLARYNIHMAATDIFGKEGMKMLRELEFPSDHAGHIVKDLLDHIEYLNREIKELRKYLNRHLGPDKRVDWLTTLPGIGRLSAYYLVAEIGEISRFPNPRKFVAYSELAPTTRSSADRTYHGRPRGGRRLLKWVLIEAAHTAARRDSYFAQEFHKLSRKKGKKIAYSVVARKMSVIIWHMLTEGRGYETKKKTTQVGSTRAIAV